MQTCRKDGSLSGREQMVNKFKLVSFFNSLSPTSQLVSKCRRKWIETKKIVLFAKRYIKLSPMSFCILVFLFLKLEIAKQIFSIPCKSYYYLFLFLENRSVQNHSVDVENISGQVRITSEVIQILWASEVSLSGRILILIFSQGLPNVGAMMIHDHHACS